MSSCSIKRNKEGKVLNVVTPLGLDSKVFDTVVRNPFIGDPEIAVQVTSNMYSNTVQDMYKTVDDINLKYEESNEPRIYLKDSKGNISESLEDVVIQGNVGQMSLGILDPKTKEFISLVDFNTSSSPVSQSIVAGISEGLISAEMERMPDGSIRHKGKGQFGHSQLVNARAFRTDFVSETGIPATVHSDGTVEVKEISDFIPLVNKNGEIEIVHASEVMEKLKSKNYTNYAEAIVASQDILGIKFDARDNNLSKNKSEKALMKKMDAFLRGLGFSLTTMEEYKKAYKNRHGQDPDVSALIDMANRMVAIAEEGSQEELITEEVAHLAVEAYKDQESLLEALLEVDSTPEYAQWAEIYREKYKHQAEGLELEDMVRKEILGKIIARQVQEQSLNEANQTIWQKFVNMLKSVVTPNHRKVLDRVVSDISSAIVKGETSKFAIENTIDGKGVFYSVKSSTDKIIETLKDTERLINGIAEQASRHGGTGLRLKLKQLAGVATERDVIAQITDVMQTIDSSLDAFEFTASNEITGADIIRAKVLKQITTDVFQTFITRLDNVTGTDTKPVAKQLIQTLEALRSKGAKVFEKIESRSENIFDKTVEDITDSLGLSEEERQAVRGSFDNVIKDVNKLASTYGLISESSNPFLSLLGALSAKMRARVQQLSQSVVNKTIDLAQAKGWDSKIQESILEKNDSGTLSGFIKSGLKQWLFEANEKVHQIETLQKLTGLSKSEVERQFNTKDIQDILGKDEAKIDEYNESLKKWRFENTEQPMTDEYYRLRDELHRKANVSEETIDEIRADNQVIRDIQSNSKYLDKNGRLDRTKMTEADKITLEKNLMRKKQKASAIDQFGEVRQGLEIVQVRDLTDEQKAKLPGYGTPEMQSTYDHLFSNPTNKVVLPTEALDNLSSEARYALDSFNMNTIKRAEFANNSSNKDVTVYTEAIKEFEDRGDYAGALEFAIENGSLVFTDAYYEDMGGIDFVEEVQKTISNISDTSVQNGIALMLEDYKDMANRRAEILKSYRSSRDYSEVLADNMSTPQKDTFKELEFEMSELQSAIKNTLKKQGIILPEPAAGQNITNLSTNRAFEGELIESGKDLIDFMLDSMHKENAKKVRRFEDYISKVFKYGANAQTKQRMEDIITNLSERFPEEYQEAVSKATNAETVEALTTLYAKTKLPAYYKKSVPKELSDTIASIEDGTIKLSEVLSNKTSISKYLDIQPNFGWVEFSNNKSLVNPKYKKAFGGRMPKFDKYKDSEWFSHYDISEDDYHANEDIQSMTARSNQNEFDFHKEMIRLRRESDATYKFEGNIYQAIQQSMSTWQKVKTSTRKGGLKSGLKDMFTDIVQDKVDELQYGEVVEGGISGVDSVKLPPRYFRKRLEDPNAITRDTLSAYLLDYVKAQEYKARLDMTDQFEAVRTKIAHSKFSDSSIIKSKSSINKRGETSETMRRAQEQIDYALYGIKQNVRMEVDAFGKKVDITRIIDKVRKFSVFNNLAYNPFVAGTSATTGVVNNMIDRFSGSIYSTDAQNKANKYIIGDVAKFISQDGSIVQKSRLNTLMEAFGMRGMEQRFNESNSSRVGRLVSESPMKMDELANLTVIPRVLYSTLLDHRVVEIDDGNGNKTYKVLPYSKFKERMAKAGITNKSEVNSRWKLLTTFFDLLDTTNGEMKMVKNSPISQEMFDEQVNVIASKAQQQNQRVDGMITDFDKTTAQRNVFLNLTMQHKGWFPVIMAQQWKGRGFNYISGRTEEGYMRTGLKLLGSILSDIKNPKGAYTKFMSEADEFQKANLKRALIATTAYALAMALVAGFMGADDGEDDSWLEDYSALIMYRTFSEVKSNNLIGTVNTILSTVQEPFTALSTVSDNIDLMKAMVGLGRSGDDSYGENLSKKLNKTIVGRPSKIMNVDETTNSWMYFQGKQGQWEFEYIKGLLND